MWIDVGHAKRRQKINPDTGNNLSTAALKLIRHSLKGLIVIYRVAVSPLTKPCCRFYPTCSSYALEAIDKFGLARGSWLALMRIMRCQPFCESGVDFIPAKFEWFPRRNPVDFCGCEEHPGIERS